ncbi:hypothetical protein JZ751_014971 [Albula glossodonta]|uniref:Adhesion G-protein coupled receptor G2 n=1 Tax=Albula glossodonta TaxID=121402 RepID=A0A8T2MW82_9TELE|nr:hypothetical protein JZ751_014971 [Albula glossodonta]
MTTLPLTSATQKYTSDIPLIYTAQQNTTLPLTALTQQNTTTPPRTSTAQQNTTDIPMPSVKHPNTTTFPLISTTQQYTTALPFTSVTQQTTSNVPMTATQQENTTETLSTQENTKFVPLNTTAQYNTTELPLKFTTHKQSLNTTSLQLNSTTQPNTTGISLMITMPYNTTYNTTSLPPDPTQEHTTASPLDTTTLLNTTQNVTTALPVVMVTQQNTTALIESTTANKTAGLSVMTTTLYNPTAVPINTTQPHRTALQPDATTQQNTTAIPMNTTSSDNVTAVPVIIATQSSTTALPPVITTQQDTTALFTPLPNTTAYNTTGLPLLNTIPHNTTAIPVNTTVPYITVVNPVNTTQNSTTEVPIIMATQQNATALLVNTMTPTSTTTIPLKNTFPNNTTTFLTSVAEFNTTAVLAVEHSATSFPLYTTMPPNSTQPDTTTSPQRMTTALNAGSLQLNTTMQPSITAPSATATQNNVTTFPVKIATQLNKTTASQRTTQQESTASLPVNVTQKHTTVPVINTMRNVTTESSNTATNGTAVKKPHPTGPTRWPSPVSALSFNTTTKPTKTTTSASSTKPVVIPPVVPTGVPQANSTTAQTTSGFTTVMTTMSAEEQAEQLLAQTRNVSALNSSQVEQLVSGLEHLLSGPNVSLEVGRTLVTLISNLLNASADSLAASSSRIIRAVETLGLKLVVEGETQTITSEFLALAVKMVDGASFEETSFTVSDPTDLQISIRGNRAQRSLTLRSSSLGSITLPPSLTDDLTPQDQLLASRVQFNYFQRSTVFQDRALGSRILNSGILGTSVANLSISGLHENVVFTLQNNQPIPVWRTVLGREFLTRLFGNFVASCVFWDFSRNGGSGGWNSDGCSVQNSTDEETSCSCSHLTSFAVLLDLSREGITDRMQATILTFITYIGCGISAIFLSITLLTYLAFEKLRRDIPSKILIQLCAALLLLNLTFLLDSWLALYPHAVGLCISTAFFLHYFLLVSFTWMGLEALHMYLAIVKVFNTYMSKYMLKFSLLGWGVPLVVVIIVIAISKDNYGLVSYGRYSDGSIDEFCWLRNDIAFYVAVVAYFCLVFVVNLAMFVVVMVQLCRIKRQNPHNSQHRSGLQELRSVAGLTFLLGLTWGFAFFAWGPVNLAFMYLFATFNSLQEWSRTATHSNTKKDSVFTATSFQTSSSMLASSTPRSSTSSPPSDSAELPSPAGGSFEDTSLEETNGDVIFNDMSRTVGLQVHILLRGNAVPRRSPGSNPPM